ncbi:MAG: phage portal protein [Clostridia bacterium]|nr:phage portal protein [Clostridia bacterium]
MIRTWLTSSGYMLPEDDTYAAMQTWMSWYRGYVADFHRYWVYTGGSKRRTRLTRATLKMAKSVCAEHAKLLINDRVRITCEGFNELDAILARTDFRAQANRLIELAFALGTGAFVEYKAADGSPVIDFVRGDMVFPLCWRGTTVTNCAFGSRITLPDGKRGYYIQLHEQLPGKVYRIRNVYLNQEGKQIPAPEDVQAEILTGSTSPLFQLIRPARVNSVDLDSPLGMSVFGDAIDQLRGVDLIYDSYLNEFTLGRKRCMVPQTMATMLQEKDGIVAPRFDPKDTVFYVYEQSLDGKQDLRFIDPTLRVDEHTKALQQMLDLLSFKCDLGIGRFRFEGGTVKTAKEVIAQNSDLYQSIKRNEQVIESAIFDMIRALAFLSGHTADCTPVITFDDSVFEDDDATATRNVLLVNAGLRTRTDAIMSVDRVDEAIAKQKVAAILKEERGQLDDFPEAD